MSVLYRNKSSFCIIAFAVLLSCSLFFNCAKRSMMPATKVYPDRDVDTLIRLVADRQLRDLGEGFVVALTPEYMEGRARRVPQHLLCRLHRGDFAIQAHIDLHGLTVRQARPALDGFLRGCLNSGKRAVLVVHGRGLSSPRKPVLKGRVAAWLSRSPWSKWVLAYCSARQCDGGAGATYVLLRASGKSRG